jgi:hypothetical protein
MGRDEKLARLCPADSLGKPAGDVEAGLVIKVDIDKDDVRLQLTTGSVRLRPCQRDATTLIPSCSSRELAAFRKPALSSTMTHRTGRGSSLGDRAARGMAAS